MTQEQMQSVETYSKKIMPANLATQPMIYISTVQRCDTAVSTSGKIEVLNTKGANVIKTLTLKNEAEQPISPRFFTAAGDNVYFTAYDGTVSRMIHFFGNHRQIEFRRIPRGLDKCQR